MPIHRLLVLAVGILLSLVACTTSYSSTGSTTSTTTATLIACEMTPIPNRSILPAFTPSYPCELENAHIQVDSCKCFRSEEAYEIIIGQEGGILLIQRYYYLSVGCVEGATFRTRSLRVCDSRSGQSTTLAEDVLGNPILSPDQAWFAFVAAEPGSYRAKSHVFFVRSNGTDLVRFDAEPFAQDQPVRVHILQWSEDGKWLEVLLWDGHEGGPHHYRIRPDGSGEFEVLPSTPTPYVTPTPKVGG